MNTATIMLCPRDMLGHIYMGPSCVDTVRDNLSRYTSCKPIDVGDKQGEEAADEMFDLTNNPGRDAERAEKYGRGRSLSSGDVVLVDGVRYLCMSIGWKVL